MTDAVERAARAMVPDDPDAYDDVVSGPSWWTFEGEAYAALSALRPGDRLPGGLVVVPEEATEEMIRANWRSIKEAAPEERMKCEMMPTETAHRHKALCRWRAMIAAAGKEG